MIPKLARTRVSELKGFDVSCVHHPFHPRQTLPGSLVTKLVKERIAGEAGFQVVALDISETALKTLEARLKTASIDNVTLVRHDMLELPFTSDYFDGVICTNVLHHGKLVQIKRATEEVHRVMREGTSAFVVALSTADFRRGNGRKLEPNTYVFTEGEERGIIHHFFSRHELQSCFKEFEVVSFEERLLPVEEGGNRAHFLVRLRKS